jgi:hypothetical protein
MMPASSQFYRSHLNSTVIIPIRPLSSPFYREKVGHHREKGSPTRLHCLVQTISLSVSSAQIRLRPIRQGLITPLFCSLVLYRTASRTQSRECRRLACQFTDAPLPCHRWSAAMLPLLLTPSILHYSHLGSMAAHR